MFSEAISVYLMLAEMSEPFEIFLDALMFRAIVFFGLAISAFAQRNVGRARKCSGKFFGYDSAATRNAPKQSVAGQARRKDD